jgi:hypothetical protein
MFRDYSITILKQYKIIIITIIEALNGGKSSIATISAAITSPLLISSILLCTFPNGNLLNEISVTI